MKNTKKYISAVLILATGCSITGCCTTPKQITKIEKLDGNEIKKNNYIYNRLDELEHQKTYIKKPSSIIEETTISETVKEPETTIQETIKETAAQQKEEVKVDNRTSVSMQNLNLNKSLPSEYQELWNKIMEMYNAGERGNNVLIDYTKLTYEQHQDMFENYCSLFPDIKYINDIDILQYDLYHSSFTQQDPDTKELVDRPYVDFSVLDELITYSKYAETQISKAISEIGINNSWKEEDAVIAINNYITNITDYDYSYSRFTMKDCFEGSVVCAGYASTFQAICSTIGIKCDIITGSANGGSHAWNRVYIDGTYKYVDCTWNDTAKSNNWLLLSEGEMNKDHVQKRIITI